ATGLGLAPPAKGRPRPRLPGRLPPCARRRRRARPRDGLRLLARPRRRPAADRRRRRGGRRTRLAVRPRWPDRELGAVTAIRLAGGLALRAGAARRPRARPDRRL